MTKHNDPFFEMFREGLANHEVAPSAGSWDAIRSQTTRGGFWRFAWNSLNVFYVVAAAGLLSAIAMTSFTTSFTANSIHTSEEKIDLKRMVFNATQLVETEELEAPAAQPQRIQRTQMPILTQVGETNEPEMEVIQEQEPLVIVSQEGSNTQEEFMQTVDPLLEVNADLSNLKEALKAEGDKVYLKIPVKVTVEDK